MGIDSCRRIEHARCDRAPGCGIDLTQPVHAGSSPADDVDACVRFYDDACLHGLVTTVDPGAVQVEACVKAIAQGTCDVVRSPETSPTCGFLVPAPVPDAGTQSQTPGALDGSLDAATISETDAALQADAGG